jgi:hypothetical protein
MTASFAAFEQEFIQYTGEIIWCTFTTVGPNGGPRSRVLPSDLAGDRGQTSRLRRYR